MGGSFLVDMDRSHLVLWETLKQGQEDQGLKRMGLGAGGNFVIPGKGKGCCGQGEGEDRERRTGRRIHCGEAGANVGMCRKNAYLAYSPLFYYHPLSTYYYPYHHPSCNLDLDLEYLVCWGLSFKEPEFTISVVDFEALDVVVIDGMVAFSVFVAFAIFDSHFMGGRVGR